MKKTSKSRDETREKIKVIDTHKQHHFHFASRYTHNTADTEKILWNKKFVILKRVSRNFSDCAGISFEELKKIKFIIFSAIIRGSFVGRNLTLMVLRSSERLLNETDL